MSRRTGPVPLAAGRVRPPRWNASTAAAAGLLAGGLLDVVVADPRRWHPVAGFGRAAAALERALYQRSRQAGAWYAIAAVGVPVSLAAAAASATRHHPTARAVLVGATTWAVLGGASLRREARRMAELLAAGDLGSARARLRNLCGRDPEVLDADGLARATLESVAENTADAVVAPLYWGAVAGLPGLVGYRALNTLDAMVGHRNERYERFGWAAARLDDAANLVPARLTGLLIALGARAGGGSTRRGLAVWRRDGRRHPSPNAGQCEAAMAGALGVRLGGRNQYAGAAEDRPELGDGPRPDPRDIRRSAVISQVTGWAALALAVGHALTTPWRRRLLRRAVSAVYAVLQ